MCLLIMTCLFASASLSRKVEGPPSEQKTHFLDLHISFTSFAPNLKPLEDWEKCYVWWPDSLPFEFGNSPQRHPVTHLAPRADGSFEHGSWERVWQLCSPSHPATTLGQRHDIMENAVSALQDFKTSLKEAQPCSTCIFRGVCVLFN